MCILCLRCEDTIHVLALLCTSLPITTTVAGESLNSLIFHDDNNGIATNKQTIIYVGANKLSYDHYHFAQKILWKC